MHNKRYYMGWFMAFVAVALFSTKAIVVKLMYKYSGVDAVNTVALRMLIALPIFAYTAYYTWQPLTKKQLCQIILAGFLGYYAASFIDFIALQYITSSLERLILFLNPGIVLILSWIIFRHTINRWQLLSLLMGYISVFIVFGHEHLGGSNVALGAILAFISVICYSLYLILCASAVSQIGAIRLTSMASCVASIFCITQVFILRENPIHEILGLQWQIYILSSINAIFCTVIPIFLTMLAIERCGASITSQTGIIGPMVTIFLGVLLLDEKVTIYHFIGTIGVIISMLLLSKGVKLQAKQINNEISS